MNTVNDDLIPVWQLFGDEHQPRDWTVLRWYEFADYPLEDWRDFMFAKTAEERQRYFDRWRAPESWRSCFDDHWYQFFYCEDLDD